MPDSSHSNRIHFTGQGHLKKSKDARVICNLDHIGCNPEAIKELRDIGIKVKTHPRLHAKVYATPTVAIIGSSNASTNGLSAEGDNALGWKEANVVTDDAMMIADAQRFFEEHWSAPEARWVTKAMMKAALARPRSAVLTILDPPKAKTLIAACRERPDVFEHIIVYPYTEMLSEHAEQRMLEFTRRTRASKAGNDEPNFKSAWGYEDGNIPKDVWIVDLDCTLTSGKPKVRGCARSVGVAIELDDGGWLTIAPRGIVNIGGTSYKIAREEKNLLEAAGQQLLEASRAHYVTLPQAVKIADRIATRR